MHLPDIFALQRDGGSGRKGKPCQHADAGAEHQRRAALPLRKYLIQHSHQSAALDQQANPRRRQQQNAQTGVEHIAGAGGEAAQLLPQQRGRGTGLFCGPFPVDPLFRGPRGRGDLQEAPGDQIPDQRQRRQRDRGKDGHGSAVAGAGLSEDIKGIGRAFDLRAVFRRVLHQRLDHALGLKIEEIVSAEEDQRHQYRDEAPVFQLQADLCHHPAQRTGQRQHQQRDHQRQDQPAGHGPRRSRDGEPVNDHGGQDHHAGIHQAHEINAQQPGRHDGPHRDGHGKQQVVVPGQIQAGIGVEHAAEGPQQDRHQPHQREIQPVHTRRRQRAANAFGHESEHTADDAQHQNGKEQDIGEIMYQIFQ